MYLWHPVIEIECRPKLSILILVESALVIQVNFVGAFGPSGDEDRVEHASRPVDHQQEHEHELKNPNSLNHFWTEPYELYHFFQPEKSEYFYHRGVPEDGYVGEQVEGDAGQEVDPKEEFEVVDCYQLWICHLLASLCPHLGPAKRYYDINGIYRLDYHVYHIDEIEGLRAEGVAPERMLERHHEAVIYDQYAGQKVELPYMRAIVIYNTTRGSLIKPRPLFRLVQRIELLQVGPTVHFLVAILRFFQRRLLLQFESLQD
jgi:hypothetical protein